MSKEYYEIWAYTWKEEKQDHDYGKFYSCKSKELAQKVFDNFEVSADIPQIELWHNVVNDEGELEYTRIKFKDELGEYKNE